VRKANDLYQGQDKQVMQDVPNRAKEKQEEETERMINGD
jgi:hypothetical protein